METTQRLSISTQLVFLSPIDGRVLQNQGLQNARTHRGRMGRWLPTIRNQSLCYISNKSVLLLQLEVIVLGNHPISQLEFSQQFLDLVQATIVLLPLI